MKKETDVMKKILVFQNELIFVQLDELDRITHT